MLFTAICANFWVPEAAAMLRLNADNVQVNTESFHMFATGLSSELCAPTIRMKRSSSSCLHTNELVAVCMIFCCFRQSLYVIDASISGSLVDGP